MLRRNPFLFLLFLMAGCAQQVSVRGPLNPGRLPVEDFLVATGRDTVVHTRKGAILRIAKGSFSGGDEKVTLKVREAYSLMDMVLGGLVTETNGKPLTSGGMIEIKATNDVKIVKSIGVSLPTDAVNPEMQVYKGEVKDGRMNWTDPQPLPQSPVMDSIGHGKLLFQQNCASCHDIKKEPNIPALSQSQEPAPNANKRDAYKFIQNSADEKVLSGPALAHFQLRGPWADDEKVFRFIQNPAGFIRDVDTILLDHLDIDPYLYCLVQAYGTIMPAYPQLSRSDVSMITNYVKSETARLAIPVPGMSCEDSCRIYDSIQIVIEKKIRTRQWKVDSMTKDNGTRYKVTYRDPVTGRDESGDLGIEPKNDWVQTENPAATYYQFEIDAFGWYNIDDLLNLKDAVPSTLVVSIEGKLRDDIQVFLALPDYTLFGQGGKLKDEEYLHGFMYNDGQLPLPLGTRAIVLAMGEGEEGIYFAAKEFTTTQDNRVSLTPAAIDSAGLDDAMRRLNLGKFSLRNKQTKNAAAIRRAVEEIRNDLKLIDKYKPQCNCCHQPYPEIVDDYTTYR